MVEVTKYNHFNRDVSVIAEHKGQHRDLCLCWQGCEQFTPDNRETNCPIASALFAICVDHHVVTPVLECAEYSTRNLSHTLEGR